MPTHLRSAFLALALVAPLLFTGCQTTQSFEGIQSTTMSRSAMNAAIKAEAPGDYYIGRRFYKVDYKFWGWVRKPGQAWSQAQLVMMNEQTKLAPDREAGKFGSDNNYEYKLIGDYSGQIVYEPASNAKYPEFVLKSAELISTNPANIYNVSGATDPARRVIAHPY
ncbi:MAG TPA: hypothetical protein VGO11_07085 [Chthoniobacteraceae bacterium]|jgi:hypothetical protein|nr:hypothetical protein [Chthoniobacteraceae bacterium]